MALGIHIPKRKKMSITKNITVFNKPQSVSIPLIVQVDTNITVLVKKGDYVKKGDIIGRRKGDYKITIHASVSGTVRGIEDHSYLNGNLVKCLVIENDFKEKTADHLLPNHPLNEYSKEEFTHLLKESGIIGMGGGAFPTYLKYQTNHQPKILIVNAVECEPYITADDMLIKEHCEEILEAIDAILEINQMEKCYFAIKIGNPELRELIRNFIGTYLKIELVEVPNLYPMGWERNLVKHILGKNYQTLPIEKGIIVNNVATIYAIYETLKYHRPLTDRVVTFTGELLKKPQNVLVKMGTSTREVIESLDGYKRNKDLIFVAGGPMMGTSLPTDDLMVTPNLSCVLVIKQEVEESSTCLRCGKCVDACPSKLSPVLIKDYVEDTEMLKELESTRCISCGLCSYVCPAKIRVREYVKQANRNLKKEGELK